MAFIALLAACAAAAAAAADSAHFAVTAVRSPLPERFVGLSIEVGSAPAVFYAGGLSGAPRRSFATLMNTLRAASGSAQGPDIRIGGNSADESAWVPAPAPLPVNTTYRITDADLRAYATAVPAWNGTVTIDATLRYGADPSYMVAHVAAAAKALGFAPGGLIQGVEIGNGA